MYREKGWLTLLWTHQFFPYLTKSRCKFYAFNSKCYVTHLMGNKGTEVLRTIDAFVPRHCCPLLLGRVFIPMPIICSESHRCGRGTLNPETEHNGSGGGRLRIRKSLHLGLSSCPAPTKLQLKLKGFLLNSHYHAEIKDQDLYKRRSDGCVTN